MKNILRIVITIVVMVLISSIFLMREGKGITSPSMNYVIGIIGIIILGVAFFFKLKNKKF